jgi:hypothetical protein
MWATAPFPAWPYAPPRAPTACQSCRTERRFDLQAALPPSSDRVERDGLRLYGLETALIEASPRYFVNHATDARAALAMIRDASDLLTKLLDGGRRKPLT